MERLSDSLEHQVEEIISFVNDVIIHPSDNLAKLTDSDTNVSLLGSAEVRSHSYYCQSCIDAVSNNANPSILNSGTAHDSDTTVQLILSNNTDASDGDEFKVSSEPEEPRAFSLETNELSTPVAECSCPGTIQVGNTWVQIVDSVKVELECELRQHFSSKHSRTVHYRPIKSTSKVKIHGSLENYKLNSRSNLKHELSLGLPFKADAEAMAHIQEFSVATQNRYIIHSVEKNYGNLSDATVSFKTVPHFHHYQGARGPHIEFDGHPFVLIGKKRLTCHQGVDKNVSKKRKYTEELMAQDVQNGEMRYQHQGFRRRVVPTRKVGCPAYLHILHIVRFPSVKIKKNTVRCRLEGSKKLKHLLREDPALPRETLFIVNRPKQEDHHGHDLITSRSLPIHPVLRQAIMQFMVHADVRSGTEMMKFVECFRHSYFSEREPPPPTDSRWFPKPMGVKNAMMSIRRAMEKGDRDPITGKKKEGGGGEWGPVVALDQVGQVEAERFGDHAVDSTLDIAEVLEIASQDFPSQEVVALVDDAEAEIAARNLMAIQTGAPRVAKNMATFQSDEALGLEGSLPPAVKRRKVSKRPVDLATLSSRCEGLLQKLMVLARTTTSVDTLQRLQTTCSRSLREVRSSIPKDVLRTLDLPAKKKKVVRQDHQGFAQMPPDDVKQLYYPAGFGGL